MIILARHNLIFVLTPISCEIGICKFYLFVVFNQLTCPTSSPHLVLLYNTTLANHLKLGWHLGDNFFQDFCIFFKSNGFSQSLSGHSNIRYLA